jgi:hypothetical protein
MASRCLGVGAWWPSAREGSHSDVLCDPSLVSAGSRFDSCPLPVPTLWAKRRVSRHGRRGNYEVGARAGSRWVLLPSQAGPVTMRAVCALIDSSSGRFLRCSIAPNTLSRPFRGPSLRCGDHGDERSACSICSRSLACLYGHAGRRGPPSSSRVVGGQSRSCARSILGVPWTTLRGW